MTQDEKAAEQQAAKRAAAHAAVDAAIHAKPDGEMMARLMRNLKGGPVRAGTRVPGRVDGLLRSQSQVETAKIEQAASERTARRQRGKMFDARQRPASVSERDWTLLRLVDVDGMMTYAAAKQVGIPLVSCRRRMAQSSPVISRSESRYV